MKMPRRQAAPSASGPIPATEGAYVPDTKPDPASTEAEARRIALPKRQPTDAFLAFYRAGERARAAGFHVRGEPFWNQVIYGHPTGADGEPLLAGATVL